MCRLFAMTSENPISPMVALEALDVMREGHDGSGVGLFLRDLAGPFEDIKDAPILSGIFTEQGLKRLAEVDRALKSSTNAPKILLEDVVIDLCLPS